MNALLACYVSHVRAARRERRTGCYLNAEAYMATALTYRAAYLKERSST